MCFRNHHDVLQTKTNLSTQGDRTNRPSFMFVESTWHSVGASVLVFGLKLIGSGKNITASGFFSWKHTSICTNIFVLSLRPLNTCFCHRPIAIEAFVSCYMFFTKCCLTPQVRENTITTKTNTHLDSTIRTFVLQYMTFIIRKLGSNTLGTNTALSWPMFQRHLQLISFSEQCANWKQATPKIPLEPPHPQFEKSHRDVKWSYRHNM